MLSFLYVYSDHSILECYNLFSGVELSLRSFFVIIIIMLSCKLCKEFISNLAAVFANDTLKIGNFHFGTF